MTVGRAKDGAGEPVPRYRPYHGPALFAQGFRPFFLGAGVWAVAAVALWLAAFAGYLTMPSAFFDVFWHAHEMLFGYVAAVIAGFMLTAVPNWTGRMPLQGPALALLFAVWAAGRIAVAVSAAIGAGLAAAIDLAFLGILLGAVLREIVAGRNRRNLAMPAALAVLLAANALMHADALGLAATGAIGLRLGIGTVIVLISLVGGRIVPSFTRNWLKKRGETRLPAPTDGLDRLGLLVVGAALALWTALPNGPFAGWALILAAAASLARLARWRGERTLAEPLVWSLHLGFAWIPVGLALTGLAALVPDMPPSAGLHALTVGAMGMMTVAVMTRATLGHTGRALAADRPTTAIYALVTAAAALRVAAPFAVEAYALLLWLSGACWIAGFGLFAVRYGGYHLRRRPRPTPPGATSAAGGGRSPSP